ncbi:MULTISPECIES: hypothetical protein [Streptomyces]|uniref:Uncharacterized protein n=1 Tax=Streptomyces virginiae TaxID=1961 RepID=A0ABZ1TLY4_STRVG|nr:hypothetical protein [Streptomyces virginiae]
MTMETATGPLEALEVYVPSREQTEAKATRKHTFLEGLAAALPTGEAATA